MTFNLHNTHTIVVIWLCRAALTSDNTMWHLRVISWTAAVAQTSLNPSNHVANSRAGGWGCSSLLDKWQQTAEAHIKDELLLIWRTEWHLVVHIGRSLKTESTEKVEGSPVQQFSIKLLGCVYVSLDTSKCCSSLSFYFVTCRWLVLQTEERSLDVTNTS